jgi:hypothetical protein
MFWDLTDKYFNLKGTFSNYTCHFLQLFVGKETNYSTFIWDTRHVQFLSISWRILIYWPNTFPMANKGNCINIKKGCYSNVSSNINAKIVRSSTIAFNLSANVFASYLLLFTSDINSWYDSGIFHPAGTSSNFARSSILYKSFTILWEKKNNY